MSSPRYLLDTNILSGLIRDPQGQVTEHIRRVGEHSVCTSIIVASELRFGARKRNLDNLTQRIEAILRSIVVLPFESPADDIYAEIRVYLEQRGTPIGPNDLLIAASALLNDCVLVTRNDREFSRVPGLIVENWAK